MAPAPAHERLARLKGSPDLMTYFTQPLDNRLHRFRVTVHGLCSTGEVFVELTEADQTRVESFRSRHKNYPPEARRRDLPLVDQADAFALARQMVRDWPRRRGTRFSL